jgi:hypothetical protein
LEKVRIGETDFSDNCSKKYFRRKLNMKKALALVLALVLALSMAVSAFAVEFVELKEQKAAKDEPLVIEVVDPDTYEYILYTTPVFDAVTLDVDWETEYYVALPYDVNYKDIKVTASGNVTAELVKFDPETMVIDDEGIDPLTYDVYNLKGEQVVANVSYKEALEYEAALEEANHADFKVVCDQYVNIIKITVENNFSAHYTEGKIVVEAKVGKKDYKGTLTVINDVVIFEYEEVKWAAANNEDGAALQLGAGGYSDYFTAEYGYGWEYDYEDLREWNFATVVSTTAFRAVEGKDLKLNVLSCDDDLEVSVTLKDIAAGQKGVNFFCDYILEGVNLKKDDVRPSAFGLTFLGDQVIKGEFEINVVLPINYYELREIFGLKVEEDDIISYYVIDENGKVVGGKEVDYMTADLTENVEFTVKGSNSKLGSYKLVLEVPAAESGEANPNTGAESVVGVVAALAVVSVATAAAVSLKK